MAFKLKQGQKLRLALRAILVAAVASGIALLLFIVFFGYLNTGVPKQAQATTNETMSTGSFLVNLGISPQTEANALLPYGLVFDLITNYNVPVKWVILSGKAKDATDFTHNGVNYKSGSFIVPAEFITASVSTAIESWRTQGVQGNYSVSSITVPVYMTIRSFPRIMIDNLAGNDTIITNYYTAAGIPASAYEIGNPSNLTTCHDIWVNPHGDPLWSTHGPLYNFVTAQKSFIWSQCHAVSMLEYVSNPSAPYQQLNYLTTNGLQCYQSGKCGTNPEYHAKQVPGGNATYFPDDPVSQFLGTVLNISSNGSEKWFRPLSSGGWRSTTKVLATVGTYTSPLQGTILAYGPAYGDTANGYVMYAGGHDMRGASSADAIAGQRSFLNFHFLAGKAKAPVLTANIAGNINANATSSFDVTASGGQSPYTYSWTSTAGGTFSAPAAATTDYTAPHTMVPLQSIITCVITDACGRKTFINQILTINASALPINLTSFTASAIPANKVKLDWITASEHNNAYFTISRSHDGRSFTALRMIPSKGNSSLKQSYTWIDINPLPGNSYYRLSQTDQNGAATDLQTEKVTFAASQTASAKITVGPNPFTDQITLYFSEQTDEHIRVELFSIDGRSVRKFTQEIATGADNIRLEDLGDLPRGSYILKTYHHEQEGEAFRIVKK